MAVQAAADARAAPASPPSSQASSQNTRSQQYAMLIEPSGKGRKGSAWERVGATLFRRWVGNAWDGKPLQTIAKNSPVRATDAHMAIIGHITKHELLRLISGTELSNGFILVGVRRSQELPFGGRLEGKESVIALRLERSRGRGGRIPPRAATW